MSSRGGLPAMVGKIGTSSISALADRAIDFAPKRSAVVVLLAVDGMVWVERPADANYREAVATITCKSDPDWLGDELRHEAQQRGML